ncbi:ABC-2 family transporter protein [Synechococcus sp. CS-205]|uniref:ABC transporter permease n=1 Tax=Synechococcus sp. CS-205 TaxID=2847984 RepID=UPI00223AD575|nr:ABC-2 family transporter protein [Synechococcus sp. CS-205]MCT0248446.1 ABC-2 family transporter protein [Synechococcus sp. CS-205]
MKRTLRLARVLLSVQYAYMLEYRAEIALWALSGLLPLIMLALWSGAGAAGELSLSPAALNRYFLAAFVVRQFTVVWVIHVFEEDALQGRLSPYLLQPLHPFWRYLAAHIAEQATRVPFVLAIVLVVWLLGAGTSGWPPPSSLLLGLLVTQLAFLLRFLLQSVITMACFWSERAAALDRLLLIPYLFLSGLVAPLEAFPPGLHRLAEATPFPSMVSFPARLLSGGEVDLLGGLATMAAWMGLLLPLYLLLWRAGLRRYAAMGA